MLKAYRSITGHMTFTNVAYWPKIPYWPMIIFPCWLSTWFYYYDVILNYCDVILNYFFDKKHHFGATIVLFNITITYVKMITCHLYVFIYFLFTINIWVLSLINCTSIAPLSFYTNNTC